ncbi:MAG: hypothetical protein JWP57_4323 [Spirosoma sp.]|nr:hypothetical protein [Spirosoma sp.]
MDTGEVSVGNLEGRKHYTITQDDRMLVTAYEVDKANGALSD